MSINLIFTQRLDEGLMEVCREIKDRDNLRLQHLTKKEFQDSISSYVLTPSFSLYSVSGRANERLYSLHLHQQLIRMEERQGIKVLSLPEGLKGLREFFPAKVVFWKPCSYDVLILTAEE